MNIKDVVSLLYHQGYELKEKDIKDVLLLCEFFRLEVPEACSSFID